MDSQERQMKEALRALAQHDRSLGASVAIEQAVMVCWDAEHVGSANRPDRNSRSGRIASWIPAAVAASLTWTAEPSEAQQAVVAAFTSRRLPVVAGRPDADLFIQLGPVTQRELNGPSLQLMRVQLRRDLAHRLGLAAGDVRASEIVEANVLFWGRRHRARDQI
jgi:hypothetical protein